MVKNLQDDPVIRSSMTLRRSMWQAVEAFQVREGIITTADAVRRLLKTGLDAETERSTRKDRQ